MIDTSPLPEQIAVRRAIIRGGASKGPYVDERDVPPASPGPSRFGE